MAMVFRSGLVALALTGSCLGAQVLIPGLYSTGLTPDGQAMVDGGPDWHYSVMPANAQAWVIQQPPEHWIANSATSQWVWQTASGTPTGVTRVFRHTFDLQQVNPQTLTITGVWATAGIGMDILINGVSTGQISSGPTAWSPFVIENGFVAGINTIDFVVYGQTGMAGLRVDGLVGVVHSPGPGPSPSAIGGAGLGVMWLGSRRPW